MAYKAARTVTDKFSLRTLIRKHTPQNGRRYLFNAVNKAINNPAVQERMKLGELYGYYGHGRREAHFNQTHDLRLPEFTIMMVDGKPVELNNIPASTTVAMRLDDDIVTHTQEIFSTATGDIVNSMEAGGIGGWSWVTAGPDYGRAGAEVRRFEGFDYVTTPNFISLNKSIAMLESVGDREAAIIRQCLAKGFSENAAVDIAHHFEHMRESAMFESVTPYFEGELLQLEGELIALRQQQADQQAMMEAANAAANVRLQATREFIDRLPLFLTMHQREALEHLNTPEDFQILSAMLEAARQPLPGQERHFQPAPARTPAGTGAHVHLNPGAKAPHFG